jgi:Spy/CpxP family protein refolding chaperone
MKRIILSVLVAAAVVTTSMAQEIPDRKVAGHEMKRRHHRGDEFKKLNLSEDQKAQFKALNEENRKQMAELKKIDNITVKEWNSKKEALRKDHREKMQTLLTAEQKAQLEKSKLERKAKMEERSKARMDKMKADLGLTDEQSSKLKSERAVMGEKMKAIREDKSLDDQAKKEQAKELKKKQKENMRSILTEEQLKKLDEQKQKRGSHKKIV